MKLATLSKWMLGFTIVVGAGSFMLAFQRERFPGLPVDETPLVLVGGRIYDPAGDSVIPEATVVIRGRTISRVGGDPPEGGRTLNVTGLTLLPGFIDSHVHLSAVQAVAEEADRMSWLRYLWLFARRFPERRRALIEAGVTAAKSLGDPYPWIRGMAGSIERHELGGPRIFAAGPMITAPGGHPVAALRAGGQGDTSFIVQVARQVVDPADAESTVREIAGNVDFVTAVLEKDGDPELPALSLPTLSMITRVAHANALDVLVHVGSAEDVRVALSASADGIEHLPSDAILDPEAIKALRAAGVFVDPTLTQVEERAAASADAARALRRAHANLTRLREAGVPIVVGSGSPDVQHYFGSAFQVEMRNLVAAGYTPRQVIGAATWGAAEHLGAADRLGSIEPGKLADVIAVFGDPLTDIRAAAEIVVVIADGQLLLDRLDRVRRPGGVLALRDGPPRRAPASGAAP